MPTYKEIVQKISELQRQADELWTNGQAMVIAETKHKIMEYGLTAEDFGFGVKSAVTSRRVDRKVPVRYRDNNSNT